MRVISHNLGADLIGLEGKDKTLYDKIIDLNFNRELDSLKALYNYDLSSVSIHHTNELKEDLIQKKLISKDFSEYFQLDNRKPKNKNEKQLELGYFLNL